MTPVIYCNSWKSRNHTEYLILGSGFSCESGYYLF